ncbi:MAG: hypothetical protein JNM21_17220 [Taibaiella sp.]|nr:hypothetical protein [Taibaiella sp.]
MKNLLTPLLALVATLLTSCSGSTGNVSISDRFNPEEMIANQNSLQKIVSKEMVAKVVKVPVDKLEARVEHHISRGGQYTLLYSWMSGNKKHVGDGKYQIDEYYSVSIGFVQKMHIENFEKYYGTNKGLQSQVDEMVQQKDFNKETGTAEAAYLAQYAGRRKTEKLSNIATMAFWETPIQALHVLAKDAAFTVTANFGDDEALAKRKSAELVNAILNP